MQVSQGGTSLSSELFSANGVLRGSDIMSYNNNVFGGFASMTSAVNYPAVQLSNTTAGKIILVDEVRFNSTVDDLIMLTLNAAELSTLDHLWRSVKDGVTAGTGRIMKQDITLGAGNQMAYLAVKGYTTYTFHPAFPFIISNGGTLTLNGSVNPSTLTVSFIGREFTL